LTLVPLILALGVVAARQYVAHLRWASGNGAVVLRSGWITRQTRVARFAKIQAVVLSETPFDRRHAMASVAVDTAGGSATSGGLSIPYMTRAAAGVLHRQLSAEAQRTAFEW
jgi:putative membrane protein